MKKEKKKDKKVWIWLGLSGFALILCALNIGFSIKYCEIGSNIFTAISGWVSGIATIVLGAIAFWQNKFYTILSLKNEMINEINNEKDNLLDIYNELATFTQYIKPLEHLIYAKSENDPETLAYKWETDGIFEKMLICARKFQLYRYTSENLAKLVKNIAGMATTIHAEYKKTEESWFNSQNLNVTKIQQEVKQWIVDFTNLRDCTILELNSLIEQIKTLNTISKINDKREDIFKNVEIARKCCNDELEKIAKAKKQETENGKDEDAK